MSQIIPCDEQSLALAAERLRAGHLVALPTETVYGLGANALNDEACRNIYAVKGRPPTDPLICHVAEITEGAKLWSTEGEENAACAALATRLGSKLWPGPLTIVARAASHVAPAVTGGSGFVGVRIPDHPIALALLRAAAVPVAAPSANTFGHVSPTTALHVLEDLGSRDPQLRIVDGGASTIGIESTVIKIVSPTSIEVLRRGKVSVAEIKAVLAATPAGEGSAVTVTVRDTRTKYKVASEAMDGPGQLLTHYSPNVPSFLVTPAEVAQLLAPTASIAVSAGPSAHAPDAASAAAASGPSTLLSLQSSSSSGAASDAEKKIIIIDFGDMLRPIVEAHKGSSSRIVCRSLSALGSATEASHNVFDALRWTETIAGGAVVLLPFISEFPTDGPTVHDDELLFAVEDRLFRAASGRVVAVEGRH